MEDFLKSEATKKNLKQYTVGTSLICLLLFFVYEILKPLVLKQTVDPQWTMVFITGIYAVLTLFIAVASLRSAITSERTVAVMEATLAEQKQARWAQFAPMITFTDGLVYYPIASSNNIEVKLTNLYKQPMAGLRTFLWHIEEGPGHEKEVKFSSMCCSEAVDVSSGDQAVNVILRPADLPDSQRIELGQQALAQFIRVNNGALPRSTLFLITYWHRADFNPSILVFDLRRGETTPKFVWSDEA